MQGHKCTLSNVGEKPRWTKPGFPVFQPPLKKRFWDSEVWNSELVLGKQAVSLGQKEQRSKGRRKLTPRLEWQQQAHDNFAILQCAFFPSGQVDSLQNLTFYRVFILCRITKYSRHILEGAAEAKRRTAWAPPLCWCWPGWLCPACTPLAATCHWARGAGLPETRGFIPQLQTRTSSTLRRS